MKKETKQKTFITIIILLFVIQLGTLFLVYSLNAKAISSISSTKDELQQDISSNRQEFQSKIDTLTGIIGQISSEQGDLKKQLSEVKASTSADFSGIIEEAVKGIASIRTDVSQGSGFFIANEYLITNAHVLSGARYAQAITYEGNTYNLDLVGYDLDMDVALLKASGDFPYLKLGNSGDVKIGEKVLAIGNPLGLSFTATEGIISATHRTGLNNNPYYLQTDVPLNPGNSGGPLINTKGEVIGITNFKVAGAENIGFALEINHAKDAINQISLAELNQTIVS